jgi:hypothetical protein
MEVVIFLLVLKLIFAFIEGFAKELMVLKEMHVFVDKLR